MRALCLGLAALLIALVGSAVLVLSTPQKVVIGGGASTPVPGVAISREKMDTRTSRAEAELAAVRAQVNDVGFAAVLRQDISRYFAVIGPLALLVFACPLGKAHANQIGGFAAPVTAAMLFLNPGVLGLVLLALSLILLAVFRHSSSTVGKGDA